MKFFLSYSSGLFCSPEPFTFVSLLSLSLSLEATCLFYHFYAFLSTPFFAFCFFYTLFPFSYLFLSILLCSFVLLIQKVTVERRSAVTLDCLLYLDKKNKLTEQKLCESLEAPPRFELGIKVLQTYALPLGYSAILERITRLELATSTLARWRSTRWAKSAFFGASAIIPILFHFVKGWTWKIFWPGTSRTQFHRIKGESIF